LRLDGTKLMIVVIAILVLFVDGSRASRLWATGADPSALVMKVMAALATTANPVDSLSSFDQ